MKGQAEEVSAQTKPEAVSVGPQPATRAEDAQSEELSRLNELKRREFEELKEVALGSAKRRMLALYRIADLGSPEAVEFLVQVREKLLRKGSDFRDRLEITDMLCKIARPECVPPLREILRSSGGLERWYAARGLAAIQGVESIPLLHPFFENDPDGTVRRMIREELAKLGDRSAIDSILVDLSSTDRATLGVALDAASVANVKEAAGSALQVFQKTDEKKHLGLKIRAGVTALVLGERRAFPLLVELMGTATVEEQRLSSWGSAIAKHLKGFTRQDFGQDGERWLRWWNEEGKGMPLYTAHISSTDRTAITRTAVTWGRSDASGPFIKEEIVYLDREGHSEALTDERLRLYTRAELKLLGVIWSSYAVTGIGKMGDRAFATLSRTGFPHGPTYYDLELRREGSGWKVIRASEEHVRE